MNDELTQGVPVPDEPAPDPPAETAPIFLEVVPVEELLRLINGDGELDNVTADVPIVDPDPVTLVIEQLLSKVVDLALDLGRIEEHTRAIERDTDIIQEQVTTIAQTLDRPALTTSFADYTVTEGLLLFLLLAAFLSACARMLRGGLSWLRS